MDTSPRISIQDSQPEDRLAKYLKSGRTDFRNGGSGHPELTDDGNAVRFVNAYGHAAHYCYAWKKWLIFDGKRWKVDEEDMVVLMARDVARSIRREAAGTMDGTTQRDVSKWAKTSQNSGRIGAML